MCSGLTPQLMRIGNPKLNTLGNATHDIPKSSGSEITGDYKKNMPLGRVGVKPVIVKGKLG